MMMPPPRGPLTAWLTATLRRDPAADTAAGWPPPVPGSGPEAWRDEDLQLALWCCYELHYRGFDGVHEDWEWQPAVIGFRGSLEQRWLAALRRLAGEPGARPAQEVLAEERLAKKGGDGKGPAEEKLVGEVRAGKGTAANVGAANVGAANVGAANVGAAELPNALRALAERPGGPDLSGYLARKADRGQFAEFVAHRSVYQLKEADPHSFGIPRLAGRAKAALIEIQADEYGGGRADRMHSELFRATMRWLDLDDDYGYYVPAAPAVTLAVSNVMSFFALHRRWTGALIGHLAALEMTSTGPNRRYSAGARRLGAGELARRYFDEHVEADAVHEQVAANDLCAGYAAGHPAAAADILFGAACCLAVDDLFAAHLLSCWAAGQPSLRSPAQARPAA